MSRRSNARIIFTGFAQVTLVAQYGVNNLCDCAVFVFCLFFFPFWKWL
jgi:hypothetical protein